MNVSILNPKPENKRKDEAVRATRSSCMILTPLTLRKRVLIPRPNAHRYCCRHADSGVVRIRPGLSLPVLANQAIRLLDTVMLAKLNGGGQHECLINGVGQRLRCDRAQMMFAHLRKAMRVRSLASF